jgi:hypothetical protein
MSFGKAKEYDDLPQEYLTLSSGFGPASTRLFGLLQKVAFSVDPSD